MATFALTLLTICAWIAACLLIADTLSGVVHWAEDRYDSPTWWLIGPAVIAPNLQHHEQPRAFLVNGWWKANDYQLIAGVAVCLLAWPLGWWSWQLGLIVFLAAHTNTIHQWAHRSAADNGWIVTALHRSRLIQNRAHHGRHHGGQRDSHYCALTPWMNPLLDGGGVWRGCEWLIAHIGGGEPRCDPVVMARSSNVMRLKYSRTIKLFN